MLDFSPGNLFLPASRTGLLMLYKEFFASKADETVKMLRLEENNRLYKISQNEYYAACLRFFEIFTNVHP